MRSEIEKIEEEIQKIRRSVQNAFGFCWREVLSEEEADEVDKASFEEFEEHIKPKLLAKYRPDS